MSDEWGPWIEHDGKGCPCIGEYVQCETRTNVKQTPNVKIIQKRLVETIPRRNSRHRSWWWVDGFCHVIRYRIRKPSALQELIEMIETLPAEERTDA